VKKKIIIHFLLFFLFSCSNIEFVLKNNSVTNPLKEITEVLVDKNANPIVSEELTNFFGAPKTLKYKLVVSFSENTTNRVVKTNQVASKVDFEILLEYTLLNKTKNCIIVVDSSLSRFSFMPKSSGYNFGSDRSLNSLYARSIRSGIKDFLQKLPSDINNKMCQNEN